MALKEYDSRNGQHNWFLKIGAEDILVTTRNRIWVYPHLSDPVMPCNHHIEGFGNMPNGAEQVLVSRRIGSAPIRA